MSSPSREPIQTSSANLIAELRKHRIHTDKCLPCRAADALEEKDKTIEHMHGVIAGFTKGAERRHAEIERLTAELGHAEQARDAYLTRLNELQAERDRLTRERDEQIAFKVKAIGEYGLALAERDRLREINASLCAKGIEAQQENARLRAALERISVDDYGRSGQEAGDIAREALAGTEGEYSKGSPVQE